MTTPNATAATRGSCRKKLGIAAAVFLALGLGYTAYYKIYGQYHEETDDAYVSGDLVYVNAQVGGTVIGIGADDNQPVKAGQPLVRLDPADATVALAGAQAQLGETVRQAREQYRKVDEARAVVAMRRTDLARARDDLARRRELAGSDALSAEDLAHARDAVSTAADAVNVVEKQLAVAEVPVAGSTLRQLPTVQHARAAYVQAYLAAQRDDIPAPVDGFVARRSAQVGQRVAAGTTLLAVVPLQSVWVDANFKEPQLRNIRIGQAATVSTDIYGGHVVYRGKVVGISAGSGGAFSLLPPQNATGNWIKVVQRVPVRIALDQAQLQGHPLRVGLSADVIVDTHDRSGRIDTALPLPGATLHTEVFDALLHNAETRADAIIARQAGLDE